MQWALRHNGLIGPYASQDSADQPRCSFVFVQPFIRLLRQYPGFPPQILDNLEAFDIDDRIPLTYVNEFLKEAVALTGDSDLGLKAAREVSLGDLGIIDYAMSTAATVQDAIDVASRYKLLLSDAIYFKLIIEEQRAAILLENSVLVPQAVLDFQLAVFFRNHLRTWPRTEASDYEVLFTCRKPTRIDEYERAFPAAQIRFSAPFNALVLKESDLTKPLQSADPRLHGLTIKYAEMLLACLPKVQSMTESVRELILNDLSSGGAYAKRVSRQLDISVRTLVRKLACEGTNLKYIIDDIRRRLALNYISRSDLSPAELRSLLGYSTSAAFYRAFKRWTGRTFRQYRSSQTTILPLLPTSILRDISYNMHPVDRLATPPAAFAAAK